MRLESLRRGDPIAAPICATSDPEDLWLEQPLHPELLLLVVERARRRDLGKDGSGSRSADTKSTDFAGWRAWITSTASTAAELWSKMRRERESRRIRAAWALVDDRTLKDIGISRYEIEYGRDTRHWS